MIRKLNALHQHGWAYVRQRAVPPGPYRGKRKIYRVPTNWDMVRWLGPVILKKAVRWNGLSGLHTYNWVINVEVIDGQAPRALSEVLISTKPTPYAVSTSVTEAQEGN